MFREQLCISVLGVYVFREQSYISVLGVCVLCQHGCIVFLTQKHKYYICKVLGVTQPILL